MKARVLLTGLAGAMVWAAAASGGTFGDVHAYCDDNKDDTPESFWGAGEGTREKNVVVAGIFVPGNGVAVRNAYDPVNGEPDHSVTVCQNLAARWKRFKADLGAKRDTVRFGNHPTFGGPFEAPPAQVVAIIDLGPGADESRGHDGPDRVKGGPGKDEIKTGKGRDAVNVAGGGKDKVACGSGHDKAVADREDSVRQCERLKIR